MSDHTRPGEAPRFAVIGNPVDHSKSPRIHSLFGAQLGIDLVYKKLPANSSTFRRTVSDFFESGGTGLNITVPFKGEAFNLCAHTSTEASAGKAANTLAQVDGMLEGFNTDGAGLITDIRTNLGLEITGRRVLLIGAGGASSGVLGPLLNQAPATLSLANRTRERAISLISRFESVHTMLDAPSFEDLGEIGFDIIVNATSVGISGGTLPLPKGLFDQASLVYDMSYGPAAAGFTAAARHDGATLVSDGLGMLVEQAAESFFIWHGVRPQTSDIIEILRGED
jgi:shikimate dehydrogenase